MAVIPFPQRPPAPAQPRPDNDNGCPVRVLPVVGRIDEGGNVTWTTEPPEALA